MAQVELRVAIVEDVRGLPEGLWMLIDGTAGFIGEALPDSSPVNSSPHPRFAIRPAPANHFILSHTYLYRW